MLRVCALAILSSPSTLSHTVIQTRPKKTPSYRRRPVSIAPQGPCYNPDSGVSPRNDKRRWRVFYFTGIVYVLVADQVPLWRAGVAKSFSKIRNAPMAHFLFNPNRCHTGRGSCTAHRYLDICRSCCDRCPIFCKVGHVFSRGRRCWCNSLNRRICFAQ